MKSLVLFLALCGTTVVGAAQTAATTSGPLQLPKLFPETIEVEGHLAAFNWSTHKSGFFEGIYIDVLIVRVDKVLRGTYGQKYVRVDFWGNVYPNLKLQLPEELFSGKGTWKFRLEPPSEVRPLQPELCRPLTRETVTIHYEDTNKDEQVPAFRNVDGSQEKLPSLKDLPCFILHTSDLQPASS